MTLRRTVSAALIALTLSMSTAGVAGAGVSPPSSGITPTSDIGGADLGQADSSGSGALPTTGSDVLPTVLIGAGVGCAGAALVVASRRRAASVA